MSITISTLTMKTKQLKKGNEIDFVVVLCIEYTRNNQSSIILTTL